MVSVSDDVLTRLPAALEQPSKGPYTSAMLPVAVRRGGGPARDLARYNSRVTPSVRLVLGLIAFLLIETTPVGGQSRGRQAEQFDRIAADIVRTTREYVASLERTLAIHQKDAQSAAEMVELRRDLYQRQIISRREVEIGEELLAETQRKIKETERLIREAKKIRGGIIGELAAHSEMAKMAPLPAGAYVTTTAFIRFNGTLAFSLADLPRVERFFGGRFGRSLPISALGQSPVHDRIGFDHRQAVDVAVHPDSAEGQALMRYLQGQNIPFVGVRQAVPGSSTGAHIHIGQPSRRITDRR
jgi:hypothetical protein